MVCRKEGSNKEWIERIVRSAPQKRSKMEVARERFLVWQFMFN